MGKISLFSVLLCVTLPGYVISAELETIAESNAKFSKEFFKSLNDVPGNLVSSPLSAHMVLSMTQLGARGSTASDMSTTLHLPADSITSKAGFKQLTNTLQSANSEGINLKMANRVFVKSGYSVKPEFLTAVRDGFNSVPQSVDFLNPNTRDVINQWVEQNTDEKIKNLVQEGILDENTRLILVNAIYFNGKWNLPFNGARTAKKPFYTSATESVSYPMMYLKKSFKHVNSNDIDAQLLEIPFEGNTMSFVVVLPNSRTGLSEVERKMQTSDLSALINSAESKTVILNLPKFKIETEIDLETALTKMGMGRMFGNSADFSGITDEERLKISKVFQKAIIEVNERGTEAAAATYVRAELLTAIRNVVPPVTYTVDHPFLFYLVHKTTATNHVVLFSGRVVQPRGFENFDPANLFRLNY